MTTKDQEREALEKIKAIVAEIGGDESYIGMAFKGCFEVAEENISNDFGDSWMDRFFGEVNRHNETGQQLRDAQKEVRDLKTELEMVNEQLDKVRSIRDEWKEEAETTDQQLTETRHELTEIRTKAINLELENMKLKAKLYDLMTA